MSNQPDTRYTIRPRADDEDEDEEEERKEDAQERGLLNKLLATRTVMLYGPVNDSMSRRAAQQFRLLDKEDSSTPIQVFINSPGGAVDSGFAILDWMNFIKAPVYTICCGLAASAATIMLLGGDKGHRYSLPHTRYLLHQPSQGIQGQASDVAIGAQEILRIRSQINELLSQETGQTVERIAEDTKRDYWMTAVEAVEYGLVNSIIEAAGALD